MTITTVEVKRSWVVDNHGVAVFKQRCLELEWEFHETSRVQQPSVGKDGYLEFTKDSVFCVAAQIKGGRSLWSTDQYELKANQIQRKSWKKSTIPVFGIIWDPETNGLYCCYITGTLQKQGKRDKIYTSSRNELNSKEGAKVFFDTAVAKCIAGSLALQLASDYISCLLYTSPSPRDS